MEKVPSLGSGALDTLLAYDWPGNVRELENVVERAVILCRGAPLDFHALLSHKTPPPMVTLRGRMRKVMDLDQLAREHIREVLEITGGKIYGPGGAAELLGINANTLRNRMNKLGIAYKRPRRSRQTEQITHLP
jgi:DNA-binding NtrC family response regulator